MSLDIGSIIGNVASGGVLGLLGSGITGVISIFQARNQYRHDEQMAALELQRIAAQSDAQSKLSAEQLKLAQEQGADEAFQASQLAGNATNNLSQWVADIVALVRPLALIGLSVFSVWLYPQSDAPTKQFITQVCLQCWSMAICWYFGSRQMLQFVPSKNQS